MIQDISPKKYDCAFRTDRVPGCFSYLLVYDKNSILLGTGIETGDRFIPQFSDLTASKADFKKAADAATYLFSIDDDLFFLVSSASLPNGGLTAGFSFEPLTLLREFKPKHLGFAGITGAQIARFYRSNRFCGRCGHPMVHSHTERAMVCTECGMTVYPKISPAVIVAVEDGDRIVLTLYRNRPGAYRQRALVAGFVEVGETPEDTVRREVLEETGLHVKNIRPYKMQPWSFSDTLMMGYLADLDGSDKICFQEDELDDASWFLRSEIPDIATGASVGTEMINAFKEGKI